MGTTLTGTTPQDTYDSLIKVTDNGPLSGTAKYLSDGLGNDSVLALSNARVGISTTSPSYKLHVAGDIGISDNSKLINAGGTQTYITLSSGATEFGYQDTLNFRAFNVNNPVSAMFLSSAGNVGIGTSAPSVRLHVKGTAETGSVLRLEPTTSTTIYSQVVGVNGDIQIQADPLNNEGSSAVKMFVDGSEIIRVTTDGLAFGPFAAANALDDYEEGTWTMGVSFGGASVGVIYSRSTGTYTKIGRQVTVNGYISLTSKGSSTGQARVTGLPFTNGTGSQFETPTALRITSITFADYPMANVNTNATTIDLTETTNAGVITTLSDADFSDSSEIMLSATYFV